MTDPESYKQNTLTGILLISLITALVYSNTLDASWHMDDYENIVKNPGIHLKDLYPQSIIQSFHASIDGGLYKGDTLYRPVAMFSFALNWYWGQDKVIGYHLVNITIHILTAIFLFLTVNTLLKSPNAKVSGSNIRYQAALMCACLWAIHPINTSAVTYIVQRMASLAGLFYVTGLYFYLKYRFSNSLWQKLLLITMYMISFALAFGAKQNSILLPASTLLLELIFFQEINWKIVFRPRVLITVLLIVFFLGTIFLIYAVNDPHSFFSNDPTRPFTQIERLITQPRVICFYIYQLIYPAVTQFSMDHDLVLSTSFFSPWTTFPSIIFIFSLIGMGIATLKKYPLISFSLLFYFLNHLVESTFLNLELVFEHRNYIPSMFLFVPFSLWTVKILHTYKQDKDKNFLLFLGFLIIPFVFFILGLGTFLRNMDWKTEKTIWESAMEKAPGRARPYQNLSVFYYQQNGNWDKAIQLHTTALTLKGSRPIRSRMVSYDNLSFCHVQKGNLKKAVVYGKKAVETFPTASVVTNYMLTLTIADQIDEAILALKNNINQHTLGIKGINQRTLIYLKGKKLELAYQSALEAIKKKPFSLEAITYFGYANLVNHNYDKAEYYLNKASKKNIRESMYIALCLIQNSLNHGDESKTILYTDRLLKNFSLDHISAILNNIEKESYPLLSFSMKKVRQIIVQNITQKRSAIILTLKPQISQAAHK